MKRSNMKSDIAMRSRCQSEGRIFPRRKVTSKSHLLNGGIGDFEMELSLAIQESLKYAQQNGNDIQDTQVNSIPQDGTDKFEDTYSINNVAKENVSKTNLTESESDFSSEVGRMKDLLLAQAELIQCQQEEITQKDKELKILRVENDNLQCRLTRMERRLAILRQKDGSQEIFPSQIVNELDNKVNDSLSNCNSLKRKCKYDRTTLKKQHKKHRLPSRSRRCKWGKMGKASSFSQAQTDKEEEGESDRDVDSSLEDESGSDDAASDNESTGKEEKHSDNESDCEFSKKRVYIDYPVMQTETMYHLYYPKHLSPNLEFKKIQERAAHQIEVETPSWRMNPLTNMYQLEGTENITDEAYFKRHQKFELEEKRRKRWDLQRLRELRQFEKFQEEKESALRESQDEVDLETFLPSVHDVTHIEISSTVPVMAFGQPLPYVSPAEFEIPWEISNSPSSSRFKATGGKGSKRH